MGTLVRWDRDEGMAVSREKTLDDAVRHLEWRWGCDVETSDTEDGQTKIYVVDNERPKDAIYFEGEFHEAE